MASNGDEHKEYNKDFKRNKRKMTFQNIFQQQIGSTRELSASTLEELKVLEQVEGVMRTVHALATHHRPLSDSTWLCVLHRKNGLDVPEEFSTRRAAKVFAHHIAEVERLAVRRQFVGSDFASLIIDQSEKYITQPEVLYLQTCKAGVVNRHFLGLRETWISEFDPLPDTSLAEVASEALDISEEEFMSKVVGVCSPRTEDLTEESTAAVEKENWPGKVLRVSVLAHRLEQAACDVFKTSATYRELKKLLTDLHVFYDESELDTEAVHTEALHEACRSAGVPELTPSDVIGSQWASRTLKALTTLWTIYPVLLDHLDQVLREPESTSTCNHDQTYALSQSLRYRHLVEYGHFMSDILGLLDKMLTFMRDPAHCLAGAFDMLESTVTLLRLYPEQLGAGLSRVRGAETLSGVHLIKARKTKSKNVKADKDETLMEEVKRITSEIAQRLAHQAAETPPQVVAATAITNLHKWPTTFDEAKDLGNAEVKVLADYFCTCLERVGVVVGNLSQDWMTLKTLLYEKHGEAVPTINWPRMHHEFIALTPGPLHLVSLLLALPTAHPTTEPAITALCEVSTLRRKAHHRLNDRLRIALLCKPIDGFDPKPAALHWWHATDKGTVETEESESECDSDDSMNVEEIRWPEDMLEDLEETG